MTTEFSGGGDPRRSIELLWGTRRTPRRGPKPKLTVEQITCSAVTIADAEGLPALSVRRIAEVLGVSPMSLYTYVPGKAELIDLMLDTVLGETLPTHGSWPEDLGWRDRLESVARQNWALHHRHPWMLQVSTHRPVLGPNQIARYDHELRAVEGVGLSDLEMDSVVSMITGYVQGAARASVAAAEVQRRTGLSDDEWWQANAPLLATVFDTGRHPVAARVGAAAGEAYRAASAPEHTFEFGLARILDGIEALVRTR